MPSDHPPGASPPRRHAGRPPARPRLAIGFILVTLALDAMGIGLILPVMPDLLREVTGGSLAEAALWGGALTTVFAVTQFLCGPTIGSISDRFGRRPVLLASLLVMALDYLVMAFARTVWLLLVARAVGGVTAATQSTPTPTSPTSRGRRRSQPASASSASPSASASCSAPWRAACSPASARAHPSGRPRPSRR